MAEVEMPIPNPPVLPPQEARLCNFCGRHEDHVACLVAGPKVYICGECIHICSDIYLGFLHTKARQMQEKIREMERNGGIPAVAGVSEQDLPTKGSDG